MLIKRDSHGKRQMGISIKLIGMLLPTVIAILALILILLYGNTSKIVRKKSEELLRSNTQSVVNNVDAWKGRILSVLDTERDALEHFSLNATEELSYIRHTANQYDAFPSGIYFATLDGKLIHESFVPDAGYSVFEKDWYKSGLQSEEFMFGDAYLDANTNTYVVSAFGKLKDRSGKLRGVAAADIYLDAVSDIVREVKLEETGGMFLVDKNTGIIIGHPDSSVTGTLLTEQKDALFQNVYEQMTAGKTGLLSCKDPQMGTVYLEITPIDGTPWVAVAHVPDQEVMSDLNQLAQITIMIAIVAILLLSLFIYLLLRRTVILPVREIDRVAGNIAGGSLNETISYKSNDEFGKLSENFNKTVSKLRDYVHYIDEISDILEQIGSGNLDFRLQYDYTGDFARIRTALEHISSSLTGTMREINESAAQVAGGSSQISNSAQALSQGTTEQASSIEELAATITEISSHVEKNALDARSADMQAKETAENLEQGKRQMHQMTAAMEKINHTSAEISRIIKVIEDIAFQTNILALNAAVEAARAGAAGKGFAVVADEVRNLAGKSSQASKDTAALIEEAVKAAEEGASVADQTAAALDHIVEASEKSGLLIQNISKASQEQASSLAQVTQGIDQISAVVQTNSATAEESAAASEELSAQAQTLRNLASRFKFSD